MYQTNFSAYPVTEYDLPLTELDMKGMPDVMRAMLPSCPSVRDGGWQHHACHALDSILSW